SSMDGTVVVGNEGQAELPPLRLQKENPLGLDYIMSIQSPSREPGKPVEIAVRLDDKTGALSLKGSGFERFTDVRLTGKETQNIKTDWAGIFELPHAATIDELEGRGSLKLAFNNMGAISDAAPKQSSIVEVQILLIPGVGGGPTSLGVNTYNPTGCDGETEHSICDEDHIDRTIEDIVEFVVLPMLMMGEQLSAVMLYHTQLIGHLLDAKIQLE